MKRLRIVLVLILALGLLAGCRNTGVKENGNGDTTKEPPKVEQPNTQNPEETEGTNVGGFYLEQPAEEIEKALGKADSVDSFEQGYYSEPFDKWHYKEENGFMEFIVGKNTNKVLDFTIAIPGYKTDLGAAIGDSFNTVTEKYESYKNIVSNHGEGELKGWYDLNNGQIIIFDLDKEDQSSVNLEAKPDSKVEAIRVSRIQYFD